MAVDDLLRTEAVLDRHDRGAREPAGERLGRGFEAGRLRRDDADVEVRQVARIGRRRHARREVVLSADPKPLVVQFLRMLLAAREHEHVGDLREMGGEEAADRAGTDDADSHANFAWRYFRYGSGSMSDPVTRRSSSGGRYLLPWR